MKPTALQEVSERQHAEREPIEEGPVPPTSKSVSAGFLVKTNLVVRETNQVAQRLSDEAEPGAGSREQEDSRQRLSGFLHPRDHPIT